METSGISIVQNKYKTTKSRCKVNSFFSGIGGFELGFENAGFEISYQCEVDGFCVNVLKSHWSNIPLDNDITKVCANSLPSADIWCGGFPCQDVSVARGAIGRDGLNGKKSGLFFNFYELIKKRQPEILLIENVTGLLNSHNGKDFKTILESLVKIGYGVSWRVFNSRYFGVPQSRPRVYICAWKNNPFKASFALHEFEGSSKPQKPREDFLAPQYSSQSDLVVPKVTYCLAATSGRHTGTDWSRTYISYTDRVRRLVPDEAEKLQGFPAGWTIPFSTKEKKKILSIDTNRYHAIGNAVSVPVVEWIAKRIVEIKGKNYKNSVLSISNKFTDFSSRQTQIRKWSEICEGNNEKIKWSTGGVAYQDWIINSKVYGSPFIPIQSNFVNLVEKGIVDDKYFISSSAAKGILRRVNNQGRTLFAPLYQALEKLANTQISV